MSMFAFAGVMPQERSCYRVYWLDGGDRIQEAEIIRSQDDGEAIITAREMIDGRSLELWDRGRFIGRFDPAITGL